MREKKERRNHQWKVGCNREVIKGGEVRSAKVHFIISGEGT